MDLHSLVRDYIDHGAKSFIQLDQKSQREFAAHALLCDDSDGYDMLMLTEGKTIVQLIFECVVKKRLTVFDVIENVLDDIIERKANDFEEMFDEFLDKDKIINFPFNFDAEVALDNRDRASAANEIYRQYV